MPLEYYEFYEMMGYPAPFQKELFGYFSPEHKIMGGTPLKLSRGKLSSHGLRVQSFLQKRGNIWQYIPFIELVFVTNEASFNGGESNDPVGLGVVCSRGRFRRGFFFLSLTLGLISLIQRIRGGCGCSLVYVLEEGDASLLHVKDGENDIWMIYTLAHFSLWYKKYDNLSFDIYEQNKRLKEYLPNHPLTFVIGLGQNIIVGKKMYVRKIEEILGVRLFSFWGYVVRFFSLIFVSVYNIFSKKIFHLCSNVIFGIDEKRKKILLQWKVLRGKNKK